MSPARLAASLIFVGCLAACSSSTAQTAPTGAPTAGAVADADDDPDNTATVEAAPDSSDPAQAPAPPDDSSLVQADPSGNFDAELLPTMTAQPVGRRDHDPESFTQGLVFADGRLYESRGLYGESALAEIDPMTGQTLREVELANDYFGEGLALVGDRLIQLTWKEQVAFVYDVNTFEQIDEFRYQDQGWGLCYDGTDLWMSSGSDFLTRRDPVTFEDLGRVLVTFNGAGVARLNELECIAGRVWANVWETDLIVVIDPRTGEVESRIDASGLLTDEEVNRGAGVLNGIAYDHTTESLILTGKLWPAMFEIELAG